MQFVDALGSTIEIGATVVYNQSGNLNRGIVRELHQRKRYGRPLPEVIIEHVAGKSKVNNLQGIIVVLGADGYIHW